MRKISPKVRVLANALRVIAEAQPDPAAGGFDGAGKGAIVDQFARDARDAADAFQRVAADQDAASRRARGGSCGDRESRRADRAGKRRRRRRGSAPAPPRAAGKADHVRHEVVVAFEGAGDKAGEWVGRVDDIGVGEQDVVGVGSCARPR